MSNISINSLWEDLLVEYCTPALEKTLTAVLVLPLHVIVVSILHIFWWEIFLNFVLLFVL